ncbi:MAG TPA: SDR family oxidoreductase [Gemmataceae bacterium]|nr:SDR family oxidoreductase [Gemmataceae bacterium]
MFEYRGRTALVTGASSGIGTVFVEALAAKGMNVILVARSADRLGQIATEVSGKYGVRTEIVTADLSEANAAEAVRSEVEQRGLIVDLLVNNAGFATHGYFETIPAKRDQEQVTVNVTAVVGLSRAFIPGMLTRGGGAVINIASTAAFQPLPYMAVYAATKAFLVSFSQALAEEYRGRNVHVLALCPGPTATKFFEVAGSTDLAVGKMRTAEQVVETGLRALEKGRGLAVDGTVNALNGFFAGLLPGAFTARMASKFTRPRAKTDTAGSAGS